MRKKSLALWSCFLLCSLLLAASTPCAAATDGAASTVVREVIEKSAAQGQTLGTLEKIVEIYGGYGVLASKDAVWWVKGSTAYVVNGVAAAITPKAPKAPPSVTVQKIEAAAKGEALPLPLHFSLSAEELVTSVEGALKQIAKEGEPFKSAAFKKVTYYEYSLNTGKELAAQFSFKESGGMITGIEMSGYATDNKKDKRTPLTTVLAVALLRAVVPDKEVRQPFIDIMLKSKKGGSHTSNNLTMRFKRSKNTLEISLVPAQSAQSIAKPESAEACFNLTPKKFVENYNKAAKAAKAEQRAKLGPANDTSVQVLASKHNGALLTVNAAGKVTSVIHIGTGDGTPESGASIMLGMTFAIAGVKPDWNAKQHYDVLKKLGFGTSDTLPEKASVSVGGVLFEFRFSQETGVWLIMTP